MIRFEHVSFSYGAASIVEDVSFSVPGGSFTAVVGENGAGKSTVSKLMRGLLRPTAGKIFLDGTDMAGAKASALAAKIGFLFQNPDRQICKNTVGEELLFSLAHTVPDKTRHAALCSAMLSALSLDGAADPFSLSRGERQKIALASALVHRPEVVILDEPTTGLDYMECMQIMDCVRGLNRSGVTVVMVCHDMELVLEYADRMLVMCGGRLCACGETRTVFRNQSLLQAAGLLQPQIVGLANLLGDDFAEVSTVEEMAEVVARLVTEKRAER